MFLPYKTAEEWEFLASVDFLRMELTLAQVTLCARRCATTIRLLSAAKPDAHLTVACPQCAQKLSEVRLFIR